MTRRFKSLLLVGSIAALVPLAAHAKLVDAGDVDVKFQAVGPAGMKINGTSGRLKVAESDGKLKVSVPANSLKTGIGLRDKHLRGYLEADKCPEITLEVARDKLKVPANDQEVSGEATGDFTLHCVTKPMTFKYKARRTGSDFHVQAFPEKHVDIRDHNVEVPSYLGVSVDPKVKLKVAFKAREAR